MDEDKPSRIAQRVAELDAQVKSLNMRSDELIHRADEALKRSHELMERIRRRQAVTAELQRTFTR